jgi:hypothetical protein
MTEDLRGSKRDRGAARPIESCRLHNPNGPPLPWATTRGTLCHKTNVLSNGMHCNWQLVDLELWKGFLDLANGGISLN